jgi:hypothetical protein
MSLKLYDTQFRHNKYITSVRIGKGMFRKTVNTIESHVHRDTVKMMYIMCKVKEKKSNAIP